MKMEQTECSETSAYKLQTPGNYPKESIQPTEHGESLKSRILNLSIVREKISLELLDYRTKSIIYVVCGFVIICVFCCYQYIFLGYRFNWV